MWNSNYIKSSLQLVRVAVALVVAALVALPSLAYAGRVDSLWSVTTGSFNSCHDLHFTTDGYIIVVNDKSCRAYNVETGALEYRLLLPDSVVCLASSEENGLLAIALKSTRDSLAPPTVQFWESKTGVATGHVMTFQVTPSKLMLQGSNLFVGYIDGRVEEFDCGSQELLAELPRVGSDRVTCLAHSPSGNAIAYSGGYWDPTLIVEPTTQHVLRQYVAYSQYLSFPSDTILFSSSTLQVGLYDYGRDVRISANEKMHYFIRPAMCFSAANSLMAFNSDWYNLYLIDPFIGTIWDSVVLSGEPVAAEAFSSGGDRLAVLFDDGRLEMFGINRSLSVPLSGIGVARTSAYPNPCNGEVRLSSRLDGPARVIVTDAIGERVFAKDVEDGGDVPLEVASWPSGRYSYRLSNGKVVETGSFVKVQ